jgi:hypothetical protein
MPGEVVRNKHKSTSYDRSIHAKACLTERLTEMCAIDIEPRRRNHLNLIEAQRIELDA